MGLIIMLWSLGFAATFGLGEASLSRYFGFLNGPHFVCQGIQCLELFAGASIVTRVLRATGLRTAALDIEYWNSYRSKRIKKGKKMSKNKYVRSHDSWRLCHSPSGCPRL